jgi:hypothetical protein
LLYEINHIFLDSSIGASFLWKESAAVVRFSSDVIAAMRKMPLLNGRNINLERWFYCPFF